MASYKIIMKDDQKILRRDNDDGTWSEIPFDGNNDDYKEYLELVKNGMEVVDETIAKQPSIQEQIAVLQANLEQLTKLATEQK